MAIKTFKQFNFEGMNSLMHEAKIMTNIDTYHDHIVNLQGILYQRNDLEEGISRVRSFRNNKFVSRGNQLCIYYNDKI